MDCTIQDLEDYLYGHYGDWTKELDLFMKLVEEVGEIAEILNMKDGRKKADDRDLREALGNEIADAIHYLVSIAAVNRINLQETIIEKDHEAAERYKHKINLEEFLKQKQEQDQAQ